MIRQAADFYHGMCPRPNSTEYVDMAKTLCAKCPQLRDKKPLKGKFVYYVRKYIYSCLYTYIRTKLVWYACMIGHYKELWGYDYVHICIHYNQMKLLGAMKLLYVIKLCRGVPIYRINKISAAIMANFSISAIGIF